MLGRYVTLDQVEETVNTDQVGQVLDMDEVKEIRYMDYGSCLEMLHMD